MGWVLNIASNYLRFLAGMVVLFFLTPYIVSRIGVDLFGLWSLIFAVIGLFGLLDLGFATAAIKYVAELTAGKDHAGRNQVLATLLVIYSGLGLVCLLLVGALAGTAPTWFDLNEHQQQAFTIALWLLGTAVALGFPLSLFKAILVGSGRMALVNLVELFTTLGNAALIVLLLESGYGLLGLAISTSLTMLLATLLLIPFAYRLTPDLSLSPAHFRRGRLRELGSFSFYFFIANVSVLIILRIDPVVIKAFLPLSAVAVYAIAAKVSEYTYLLNKQFSNALMPLVSQSKGAGDADTIRRVLIDGTRFLMAIAVPFIVLLYFYADDIIRLWMGSEFADSVPLLRILLIAVFFTSVQLNAANVLGMSGHHRFVAFSMGGSAIVNLVLSILLIRHFGLTGVAVATLAAALAVETLIIVPRACVMNGVTLAQFLVRALVPLLPAFAAALGTAFLLDQWQPADTFTWIIVEGAASALVFFILFYMTALEAGEKDMFKHKIMRLGSKDQANTVMD
ncbi:MAG: MATE family efflux transporter [Rhodothermales bacterium]